jgi:hypothetical protein
MRQFPPHSGLVQAISTFDTHRFRVTEIRDRYMKLYPDTQNKNDVRRWVHSFMRTFIKHGLLIDVTENSDKAAHYRATVQLRAINNPQTDKKMDDELLLNNNHPAIQKRLVARQHDILISLGATEELESLKTEFPDMAARIDQQLSAFKDQNVRTLGKIKALESLLVHH